VITDQWITESINEKKLLPWTRYLSRDKAIEKKWSMPENWSSGDMQFDNSEFKELTLYITPALRQQWGSTIFDAVTQLGKLLGFKLVTSYPAASFKEKKFIALGLQIKDSDVGELQANGHKVYARELLNATILRGDLDPMEDFLLENVPAPKGKPGRKKKTGGLEPETT
jgi:hypothetical protein